MALVVLGCGWIARRHAAAARRLRLPLIFASRDADRARRYAREFGGVGAYGDYAQALRDSRARAALVCTPHDRHLDDVLEALAAGRHVLVEKPLARTLEEADRMIAAAARAGRVLMTAENFRFMPAFRWVRRALDAGMLGARREVHLVARGWRRHAGWRLTPDAAPSSTAAFTMCTRCGGGAERSAGCSPSGRPRPSWTWPARTPSTSSPSARAAW